MNKIQYKTDKFAMSLSLVCVLHCLFVPAFFIAISSTSAMVIDNEFVHYILLVITVPVSLYALSKGLKNHKKQLIYIIGLVGLILFTLAIVFGKLFLGELGEKVLTIIASIFVIYAHYQNFTICRELECSSCHETVTSNDGKLPKVN